MMIFKTQKAFSLVEIMVGLVVISVLIGAFAPVITKKLNSNIIIGSTSASSTNSAQSQLSNNCSENFSENCILCDDKTCFLCELECSVGQIKNLSKCQCTNCQELNEGCVECNESECLKCDVGYGLNSSTKKCELCKAGYYSLVQSSNECIICPADWACFGGSNKIQWEEYYGSEEGSAQCVECDSNCKKCSNENTCLNCEEGYYLNEGYCEICPAGYYCTGGSANKIACQENMYSSSGAKSCSACANGYGSTLGSSSCFSCPTNCKKCSSTSVCTTCDSGYSINSSTKQCTKSVGCGSNCLECSDAKTCNLCDSTTSYRNDTGSCNSRCTFSFEDVCSAFCIENSSTWEGKTKLMKATVDVENIYSPYLTQETCLANSTEIGKCICNPTVETSKYFQLTPSWNSSVKVSCPDKCLSCDESGTTCYSCSTNYYPHLYNSACHVCPQEASSSENNCTQSDDRGCCIECKEEFFLTPTSSTVKTSNANTACWTRCLAVGDTITNGVNDRAGYKTQGKAHCIEKGYNYGTKYTYGFYITSNASITKELCTTGNIHADVKCCTNSDCSTTKTYIKSDWEVTWWED